MYEGFCLASFILECFFVFRLDLNALATCGQVGIGIGGLE